MLLPVSATEIERNVESFMAALALGLRKKFDGDPGHLYATVYDEPIEGTEARKRFVVLYDGVPGGTGYLKELMRDLSHLHDVLRMAYEVLSGCDCQHDDRKDGCYRCLLAYRGRFFQGRTSRTAALNLIGSILDNWDKLKETERLETIRMNRLLESELEASLLEVLRRPREGEPARSLSPHVVNGKQGWYLKIAGFGNWLIEPQVELGIHCGVKISSRADFVFYPERPAEGELPIVVFADGFEWHADPQSGSLRTGRDSAQRLAIARSERYRVWSLTWADIYERLDKPQPPVVPLCGPPGQVLAAVLAKLDPQNATTWLKQYSASSLDLLLHLMTGGRDKCWKAFAQVTMFNMIGAGAPQCAEPSSVRCALLSPQLSEDWTSSNGNGWYCRTLAKGAMNAFASLSIAEIANANFESLNAAVRLMDDLAGTLQTAVWKDAWREFLRIGNILQFAPRAVCVTSLGLQDGLYGGLIDQPEPARERAASGLDVLLAELLDEGARQIARNVFESGRVLPEIGYEFLNAQLEIVGMAEMAWPKEKICVLSESQAEFAEAVAATGWTPFPTGELLIDVQPLLAFLPPRQA
jgi:DEAD/DEAH box helicase domain-containing protein